MNEASRRRRSPPSPAGRSGDIAALASALGFVFPADYSTPARYDALRTLEAMAAATGGSGAQLVSWGAVRRRRADARRPWPPRRSACCKSRYSTATIGCVRARRSWTRSASDRSAALQDYLIGQRDSARKPDLRRHQRAVRSLSDRYADELVRGDDARRAGVHRRADLRRTLPMNLEAPAVVVDPDRDDAWDQWELDEALPHLAGEPRGVPLSRELAHRSRSARTGRRASRSSSRRSIRTRARADYLETVVLNYIDRARRGLAPLRHRHLRGSGDGRRSHVVGADARPIRRASTCAHVLDGAWDGWRRSSSTSRRTRWCRPCTRPRLCLFWLEVKVDERAAPEPARRAAVVERRRARRWRSTRR